MSMRVPAKKPAGRAKARQSMRRQAKSRISESSESPPRARSSRARWASGSEIPEPRPSGGGRGLGGRSTRSMRGMPAEEIPSAGRTERGSSGEILRTGHGSARVRGQKTHMSRVSKTGRAMNHATRSRRR